MNDSVAIVTDTNNHCLRAVNLETGQTSRFAGRCQIHGDSDGELLSEARFYYPRKLVLHKHNLYITDLKNNAIKVIREGHDHVVTVAQGGMITSPRGITVDPFSTNDMAYVTTYNGLLKLDLKTNAVTKLTGGNEAPGSLSASRPFMLNGLTFVTASILVIADSQKFRLMVADLARDKVTYICDGRSETRNGDIKMCSLRTPISVLAMSWSIYIGETGSIRRLPLKAIISSILPTDLIG